MAPRTLFQALQGERRRRRLGGRDSPRRAGCESASPPEPRVCLFVCLFVFVCLFIAPSRSALSPAAPARRTAAATEGGKPAGLEPSSRRQQAGGRGASHRSVGAALAPGPPPPQGGTDHLRGSLEEPSAGGTAPLQGNRGLGSAG